MPEVTTHMLNELYKKYNLRQIAFNPSIIKFTGLEIKKVLIKIFGEQYNCIIYSCSMKSANIIVNLDNTAFNLLKKANNYITLRFSFLPEDYKNSIVFFVPCHLEGYKNFNNNEHTYFMNLLYTKRPPDDLVKILGRIIQEKENYEKRKHIRINLVEQDILSRLGFQSNKGIAVIDKIKRPCIIKDISTGGVMIILSCIPKFLMNKQISLFMFLKFLKNPLAITGEIVRSEAIGERKDIHGIGIKFDEKKLPLELVKIINEYIDESESKNKIKDKKDIKTQESKADKLAKKKEEYENKMVE